MKEKPLTCQRPDRHNPDLICGYPLPCPYHTVIVEQDELFGGVLKDDSEDENEDDADNADNLWALSAVRRFWKWWDVVLTKVARLKRAWIFQTEKHVVIAYILKDARQSMVTQKLTRCVIGFRENLGSEIWKRMT